MTKPHLPKRDKMIGVKVTPDEYEVLRSLAFKARKSVAGYVRDRVLPKTKRE